MRSNTTRQEMSLAVLEGVAFALRDCVEAAKEGGIAITRATVCGGGAKSRVWREILANVLNCEIVSLKTEQGPSCGAAILAMVGSGLYQTIEEATALLVKPSENVIPMPVAVAKYEEKYQKFRKLYPALKGIF